LNHESKAHQLGLFDFYSFHIWPLEASGDPGPPRILCLSLSHPILVMASTSARSVLVLAKHRLPARTHSLASRRLLSVTPATSSPAPLAESHKSKAPSPAPVAPATSATPKANAGTTKPALDAHKESWFTGALRSSPLAMGIFLRAVRVLGYGTPQQIAARRTLALYEVLCSGRVEEEAKFWTEREYQILPSIQYVR
jgi:hypothetical protein